MNQTLLDQQVTKMGTGKKVLIVEDDEAMAVALRDGFTYEGYEVMCATDGVTGANMATDRKPDMVILDVMLPKMNGLDVCRLLRGQGCEVPIIMLTARGREIDKILGLKLGADDYLTKPFSMMELIVRVETILRRTTRTPDKSLELSYYAFGDITIDFERHEAFKANQPLELSPREFMLMKFLILQRGQVVTRDQLLDGVWGFETIPFTRTVDTHIAKLRKKIEVCPANPRFIVTVHRLGYKFTG